MAEPTTQAESLRAALLERIRNETREAVIEGDASDCSSADCIADAVYEIVRAALTPPAEGLAPDELMADLVVGPDPVYWAGYRDGKAAATPPTEGLDGYAVRQALRYTDWSGDNERAFSTFSKAYRAALAAAPPTEGLRKGTVSRRPGLDLTGYGPPTEGLDELPLNDKNGPWCGCGQPLGHAVPNVDCAAAPPTEERTCPDCGFTASKIGEFHINAQEAVHAGQPRPNDSCAALAAAPPTEGLDGLLQCVIEGKPSPGIEVIVPFTLGDVDVAGLSDTSRIETAIDKLRRTPPTEGLDFIAQAQRFRDEHDATHGEAEMCGGECIVMGLTEFADESPAEKP